jgi:hypothetical protein
MVVWLASDCYIKAEDGVCFELVRRYKRQKGDNIGQWVHRPIGFYSTFEHALLGAFNRAVQGKMREGGVKEMLEEVRAIGKHIAEAAMGVATASQAASIELVYTPDEIERLSFFDEV